MASGYWRDGELVPLTNAQGWFATRDRGEWHDGRLTILGRMDNLFSGGEGIQPESLERVIARHPQINQVFIVPLDDAEFGQRPVAVVECEPGTDITVYLTGSGIRWRVLSNPSAGCCCRPNSKMAALKSRAARCSSG
jgi:acyl-CoA synthetase (AMP-forming)/AMP-acid ligase II